MSDPIEVFIRGVFSTRSLEGMLNNVLKSDLSQEDKESWMRYIAREIDYRSAQIDKYGNDQIIKDSVLAEQIKLNEMLACAVLNNVELGEKAKGTLEKQDKLDAEISKAGKAQSEMREILSDLIRFEGLENILGSERARELIKDLYSIDMMKRLKDIGVNGSDTYREEMAEEDDLIDSK